VVRGRVTGTGSPDTGTFVTSCPDHAAPGCRPVLTTEQLTGAAPLPVPLPVSEHVQRVFAERAGRLPEHARTLLLVAAAEETGRLTTVLSAAGLLGVDPATLDDTERTGLVSVRRGEIIFAHPLVRSAVYQAAAVRPRHQVHLALAGVADASGDRDGRAWHLAAAALEPDGPAVRELDAAADRARRRGGHAAAGVALERAAELTADGAARCRRLIRAADDAWLAGRFRHVAELLHTARPLAAAPLLRADIGRLRGWTELSLGSPDTAHYILVEAARDAAQVDTGRARMMLVAAAESAWLASDAAMGGELGQVARGLPPRPTRATASSPTCSQGSCITWMVRSPRAPTFWPRLSPTRSAPATRRSSRLPRTRPSTSAMTPLRCG
jgi:hypothetical protein